jgi:anti-sigma factor RsiW
VNCDELVELVTAYLEGALSPEDERRVTDHLAGCDGCTTYVAQFRTTVDALGHLPEEQVAELPAQARESLLAAFRRKQV